MRPAAVSRWSLRGEGAGRTDREGHGRDRPADHRDPGGDPGIRSAPSRRSRGTIGRLSEISSAIAAAVEEQGAATQEISRNVQQAAQGTQHGLRQHHRRAARRDRDGDRHRHTCSPRRSRCRATATASSSRSPNSSSRCAPPETEHRWQMGCWTSSSGAETDCATRRCRAAGCLACAARALLGVLTTLAHT